MTGVFACASASIWATSFSRALTFMATAGLNIAARLETLASPDSICITGAVFDDVRGKISQ